MDDTYRYTVQSNMIETSGHTKKKKKKAENGRSRAEQGGATLGNSVSNRFRF